MDRVLRDKQRHDASTSLTKLLTMIAAMSGALASLFGLVQDLRGIPADRTDYPLWLLGAPIIVTVIGAALAVMALAVQRKSNEPSFSIEEVRDPELRALTTSLIRDQASFNQLLHSSDDEAGDGR